MNLPVQFRVRDYFSTARLTISPREPKINGVVSTDISLGIKQTWENCGIFGLDCDVYDESYASPPSVSYIYFDIMPRTLTQLWEWEELTNHDPDGDGLDGNIDQGVFGIDNGLCGYDQYASYVEQRSGAVRSLERSLRVVRLRIVAVPVRHR